MATLNTGVPTLQEMYALKDKYKNAINVVDDGIYVMFTYTYANRDLFNERWGKEARGIIFHKKTGTIVSRPFHKFFNSGEPGAPDNFSPKVYAEKMDGSLLQVSWDTVEDRLVVASRSTLREDTSYVINAFKSLPQEVQDAIAQYAREYSSFTHLFELLDPNNQIVIYYKDLKVVYLMSRSKQDGTYYYMPLPELDAVLWKPTEMTVERILRLAKEAQEIEGWVLFDTQLQDFVKIKTPWYLERHKVTELNRPEHYLTAWANDSLDDYLSFAVLSGNTGKAHKINSALDMLNGAFESFMESDLVKKAAAYRELPERKDAAIALQQLAKNTEFGSIVFSAAMNTYGKPVQEFINAVQNAYKSSALKSGPLRTHLLEKVRQVLQ